MTQVQMDQVAAVTRYFLTHDGADCYLPRPDWLLYWIGQGKTSAQIYAIAYNLEGRIV